jgi:polyphosphate kinase 2
VRPGQAGYEGAVVERFGAGQRFGGGQPRDETAMPGMRSPPAGLGVHEHGKRGALMLLELQERDAAKLLEEVAAELGLRLRRSGRGAPALAGADGGLAETWREEYPYPDRLGKAEYAARKRALQIELLKLQRSVKLSQSRLAIVFEGRDAAGKGGAIRCFTENLSPRGARVVALEPPTEAERREWYFRRYMRHLPAPGEIVLFDRSWYNRAGVERVMDFCAPAEYAEFLAEVPDFERMLARDGVTLVKFWFSVTRGEQLRRFVRRQVDPVKRWKLSSIDLASLRMWDQYTAAKEAMFAGTDRPEAPWIVVKSNDKRRARLEALRFVLAKGSYQGKDQQIVGCPDPLIVGPVGPVVGGQGAPVGPRARPVPVAVARSASVCGGPE